ncbi:MAG: hypothetical protein WD623_06065 [Marinobacter sp.]|uniref:hypothetical protein n=1 Tax=Marinobacter sp. TaxID=50741 RepID=UPI0034A077FD
MGLLKLGRIDAFLAERTVLYHQLKQMERPTPPLREAGIASIEPLYITFAPGHLSSENYALDLTDGINTMRKSGELARLMVRYGLPYTKQPTP